MDFSMFDIFQPITVLILIIIEAQFFPFVVSGGLFRFVSESIDITFCYLLCEDIPASLCIFFLGTWIQPDFSKKGQILLIRNSIQRLKSVCRDVYCYCSFHC